MATSQARSRIPVLLPSQAHMRESKGPLGWKGPTREQLNGKGLQGPCLWGADV